MTIVNPSIDGSVVGGRWVLKKHTNFIREFTERGTVDLIGAGTYTDLDGDDWVESDLNVPDAFELRNTGIYMQCTGNAIAQIGITPRDVIPGLRRRDPIWIIWKIVDASLPNNDNTAWARFIRRSTVNPQQAAWHLLRAAGSNQLNPYVISAGTPIETVNVLGGAYPDRLLSINASGLRYEYRQQLATIAFPSTPDPDDINIFTSGAFGGSYAGEIRANPDTSDITIDSELAQVRLDADGAGQCEITFEEFWIYRFE